MEGVGGSGRRRSADIPDSGTRGGLSRICPNCRSLAGTSGESHAAFLAGELRAQAYTIAAPRARFLIAGRVANGMENLFTKARRG